MGKQILTREQKAQEIASIEGAVIFIQRQTYGLQRCHLESESFLIIVIPFHIMVEGISSKHAIVCDNCNEIFYSERDMKNINLVKQPDF